MYKLNGLSIESPFIYGHLCMVLSSPFSWKRKFLIQWISNIYHVIWLKTRPELILTLSLYIACITFRRQAWYGCILHNIPIMCCAVCPISCTASSCKLLRWRKLVASFPWYVWFGNLIWLLLIYYPTVTRGTRRLNVNSSLLSSIFLEYSKMYQNVKYIWI